MTSISLHARDDELRKKLMPMAEYWPLPQELSSAEAYVLATGRRVTFEYVLLGGVNDSLKCARKLAALLRGKLAHVNLIPFNPVPGLPFHRPDDGQIELFRQELLMRGIDVTIRRSRGVKIQAGCGQLRSRILEAYQP